MNKRLYPLTEVTFNRMVKPLLLSYQDGRGRPVSISYYQFFCAVLYVLRTGIPWRDLPEQYGGWHTIYTRFKRWSERGWFWQLVYDLQKNRCVILDLTWVDSTTILVHRHGSGC